MSTDIYTITAVAASPDPAAVFLAVVAAILFALTLIGILLKEEVAFVLFCLGLFAGGLFLLVDTAANQDDYENRKNIAYSYNIEFLDPEQDIPDDQGTTEGYVLLNDTETVEYCVFGRNATSDEDIDTLTVTCDGDPRPVREHLQER